jgi:molybdopterin-containing oxidoreductase family membrane subunit
VSAEHLLACTDEEELYRDLSRSNLVTTAWWYIAAGAAFLVLLWGIFAFFYMAFKGLGVTGYNRPVFWGLYEANLVFWIGLSHSGTLISAILRLTHATWRAPVLRGAEAMTAFTLMVGGIIPILHLGRNWRVYYALPYPSERGLWPNMRSPLMWDAVAINTYLIGSLTFLYYGMIPDLAIARDRSSGWRRRLYSILALGFRGTHAEWRRYHASSTLFAILIIPIAVSVHSIVSWDFAMAKVPGWHSTIFAPYFVVGAIFSGIAGVILVMAVFRAVFRLEKALTPLHFDNLGKLLCTMSLIWAYFYFADFLTVWYNRNPEEWEVFRSYGTVYLPLFLLMVCCNFVVPFPLLCLKKARRSVPAVAFASLLVVVGMYCERLLIVIPSLARRNEPFIWKGYFPTWVEISVMAGLAAMFALLYILFSKIFPIMAISDIKERLFHTTERSIGSTVVEAVARAEEPRENGSR